MNNPQLHGMYKIHSLNAKANLELQLAGEYNYALYTILELLNSNKF